MYLLLKVAIVLVAFNIVTNDAAKSTNCNDIICKGACHINNELKSASTENVIEYVWCKAGQEMEDMEAQNIDFANKNIDRKYMKADTCLACLATMHETKTTDNEESRSEKFLSALSLLRSVRPDLIGDERADLQWKIVARREGVCECNTNQICRETKYRSIDGSCNNLINPDWGQAMTEQRRYAPPAFDDGVSSPRQTGVKGNPLPSAREVSNEMNVGQGGPDTVDDLQLTVMVPAFGQFLDHDFTLTPEVEGEDGAAIKCCDVNADRKQCFPITIPPKDPRFKNKCMEFKRSRPFVSNRCTTKSVRGQLNALTTFIDASNVYDSVPANAKNLRENNGHGAKLREVAPHRLLPVGPSNSCNAKRACSFCKLAGDVRVNEVSTLTTLHTCFVREHNNIVDELKKINKHWNQETLYQEARRIVGAVMQRLAYTQYLEAILDTRLMETFGINEGATYTYKNNVDPSIRTEFSTAAFRYGHSMVQTNQACVKKDFKTFILNTPLENQFFVPLLPQTCPDGVALWASSTFSKRMDSGFVSAVRNNLFLDNDGNALDLLSFNIQRARDHGIPSYLAVRKALGLQTFKNFHDLKLVMPADNVHRLQKAYSNNINDIDLYAGGVSEKPFGNGVIGVTFQNLIGRQLHAMKFGDRYWYQNTDSKVAFSAAQLKVINGVNLSDVLCDCFKLDQLQSNVFLKVSSSNPRKQCGRWVNAHNLKAWKA